MGLFFTTYSQSALAALGLGSAVPVLSKNMLSNADQGGVTPVAPADGDTYVVNNWNAATTYVGSHAGAAVAAGDIACYRLALAGWVREQAGVAGAVATNTRIVVIAAGAAGSFAGLANRKGLWDGSSWTFTPPIDTDMVRVNGDEDLHANELYSYDVDAFGGAAWVSMGRTDLSLSNSIFVDKSGNNGPNNGTLGRPYLTINYAKAIAVAGQKIVVGPGVYAETVIVNKNVDIIEWFPGTVFIRNAVVGGAVLAYTGNVGTVVCEASVENTNNAALADVAISIINTGQVIDLRFRGKQLTGGTNGTAYLVIGNAGATTRVDIVCDRMVGALSNILFNAGDLVIVDCPDHASGAGTWGTIIGGAGSLGVVRLARLFSSATGIFSFALGTACGTSLMIEKGSRIAGTLELGQTLPGAGTVVISGESYIGNIVAFVAGGSVDQAYSIRHGGDQIELVLIAIPVGVGAPPVDHAIYPLPGGLNFHPRDVWTRNRGAATGAALNYSVGSLAVPGAIVAPVGPGIFNPGIANEIVIPQVVIPGGTSVAFRTVAAGAAADQLEAHVVGMFST
jgi:hypothetical protein